MWFGYIIPLAWDDLQLHFLHSTDLSGMVNVFHLYHLCPCNAIFHSGLNGLIQNKFIQFSALHVHVMGLNKSGKSTYKEINPSSVHISIVY